MSDQALSNSQNSDIPPQLPPPSGDPRMADRYLTQLIELVNTDKLTVSHTDLSKFDPTSLQNHYRLDLKDYAVEVSHTKQPDSGKDFYILLFNNLKYISEKCTEKIILAYIHITEDQFKSFKTAVEEQLERRRKEAEEKRFKEAMAPIDSALAELAAENPEPAEDEKPNIPTETAPSSTEPDTPVDPLANPLDDNPPAFAAS